MPARRRKPIGTVLLLLLLPLALLLRRGIWLAGDGDDPRPTRDARESRPAAGDPTSRRPDADARPRPADETDRGASGPAAGSRPESRPSGDPTAGEPEAASRAADARVEGDAEELVAARINGAQQALRDGRLAAARALLADLPADLTATAAGRRFAVVRERLRQELEERTRAVLAGVRESAAAGDHLRMLAALRAAADPAVDHAARDLLHIGAPDPAAPGRARAWLAATDGDAATAATRARLRDEIDACAARVRVLRGLVVRYLDRGAVASGEVYRVEPDLDLVLRGAGSHDGQFPRVAPEVLDPGTVPALDPVAWAWWLATQGHVDAAMLLVARKPATDARVVELRRCLGG